MCLQFNLLNLYVLFKMNSGVGENFSLYFDSSKTQEE